jgi:hypothetical protein
VISRSRGSVVAHRWQCSSQTATRVSIRKDERTQRKTNQQIGGRKWATVLSDVVKAGGGLINTKLGKILSPAWTEQ